jgi:hypothetical protein
MQQTKKDLLTPSAIFVILGRQLNILLNHNFYSSRVVIKGGLFTEGARTPIGVPYIRRNQTLYNYLLMR